ncbi:MAG: hypothetical protein GTO41_25170 [Burkholderiales bacterium]|nr:hypothetical protein [Burkholderiales bacterium]
MTTQTVTLLMAVLFAAVAVAGAMAYLNAEPRRQATVCDGSLHLRFSRRYRAVWIAILLGCLGLTAHDVLAGPAGWVTPTDWVYGTLVGIALLLVVLAALIHVLRYRLNVHSDRIQAHSPWFGSRSVRWDSIASVRYAVFAGWFRVAGHGGDVIRASCYLEGIDEFAETLVRHLPPSMVDAPVARFRRIRG